ncbi:Heat shock cognate 70 kDa protein [Acorus gramineus]|uniref:Heat shock cognate 70 kDa protein n=1 Tax=Acorus gramineus TaxID=55184 RepID=A0AAV9BD72_ACOGR|nr:Heat shock cognate 70 kDa protein [Acorus gramineus]
MGDDLKQPPPPPSDPPHQQPLRHHLCCNTPPDLPRLPAPCNDTPTFAASLWPFKVIPDPGDKPMIVISFKNEQKHFVPKEISSTVLIKMKEIVQAYLEE